MAERQEHQNAFQTVLKELLDKSRYLLLDLEPHFTVPRAKKLLQLYQKFPQFQPERYSRIELNSGKRDGVKKILPRCMVQFYNNESDFCVLRDELHGLQSQLDVAVNAFICKNSITPAEMNLPKILLEMSYAVTPL